VTTPVELVWGADHTGADGYLDENAVTSDGRSHLDVTVDVLAAIGAGRDGPLPTAT